MTQLYTASYRAWTPRLGTPVVTSLGLPKWLPEARGWPRLWEATPRGSYFHASAEAFDTAYLAQLERYGPRRIARRLGAITHETGAQTLLVCCFEADPERCHRSLLSAWWLQATGERITEIGERS